MLHSGGFRKFEGQTTIFKNTQKFSKWFSVEVMLP